MNLAAKAASHLAKELVSVHHIEIHEPGSTHPSLCHDFRHEWLMGTWQIVWSTLPMWKDKKDVEITYTPREASNGQISFEDVVSSRKASNGADSKPSTVHGVNSQSNKPNAATFDWRGQKLLKATTSHWEILGYGEDSKRSLQWVVTFFSKTPSTPAGLDIYLRTTPGKTGSGAGSKRAVLETTLEKLGRNPNHEIADMVRSGFEIHGAI